MKPAAEPLSISGESDVGAVTQCLRDVVALSTLPGVWLEAEPLRVAESLAAALFMAVGPEFVYVSFAAGPGERPITVAQVDRRETSRRLADAAGPAIVEWARANDPDELLLLELEGWSAPVQVVVRPIGLKGELGAIAAAFANQAAPTAAHHLILNVAANQAATAIQNAQLVRALRESIEERDRAAQALRESQERIAGINAELSLRIAELQTAAAQLRQSRRAALNVMEDAVQAREALSQRTAQFEALVNAAPLGVYLIDADFCIRQVNPRALPTFANISNLIGRDFDEVMHILWPKQYADEVVQRFRHTLETGEPFVAAEHIEQRLDRGDTEYYDWQINRIPLPDGRYGVVCYSRDISAQVKARLAIAEAADRLRFMAESMPQKIFTAKPNGDVDYVNRQWIEFTGASFEKLKDGGWTGVLHPDDVEESIRMWRLSLETGTSFQCVHRFQRRDGTYRWHLTRAQPMRDAAGEVTMWIGSNTEIHEQKVTEEELRIANQDLEQFAYSASHDLQEPLRSITIYSELLAKRYGERLDGEALEFLKFLCDGARRMQMLIHDLLAYTQAGKADLPVETVDANKALDAALANLQESIAESGAQITYDPLPVCRLHGAHFQQLFQNLIGNAIKYRNPERSPVVHVSAERQQGFWVFSVADNGIGIPPEYKDRIFGLFKRLHSGDEYSGTGIGLAVCQRIVERRGGRIWVESEPGRGATFRFTLPADEVSG
jgi:PAS domain S-box-containing protein